MGRKSDKLLEKALKNIVSTYEEAKKCDYIYKPVAYSIYQVWKEVDRKEREMIKNGEY